jgi:antitoxin (DNA-binding transcriptional repressor) of toxin-antitoxin stability system
MARELKIGTVTLQYFRENLADCRDEVEAGATLLVTAHRKPVFAVVPVDGFEALAAFSHLSPQVFADVLKGATDENAPHLLRILAWVAHKGERK